MVECSGSAQDWRMSLSSYRDLRVRRAAIDLARDVYRLTECLPRHEAFGLTAQTRRAAVSVASNIAEGHARSGPREFMRFVWIARGSLAEVDTQLEIMGALGYVGSAEVAGLLAQIDAVSRMLMRLQQSLGRDLLRIAR
jgi:four helix bundle protein